MKKELKIGAPEGVEELLNYDDMLGEIEGFKKDDLADIRFVLIIGVRKNGSVFFRRAGFVSGLELDGLKLAVEYVADVVSEQLPDESS